jgi:hypothetical protein
MNSSHIQTNDNGKKTLIVFYDNEKADFDEQIEKALKRHDLPETTNVICMPNHDTRPSGKREYKGFAGMADDK